MKFEIGWVESTPKDPMNIVRYVTYVDAENNDEAIRLSVREMTHQAPESDYQMDFIQQCIQ